MRELFTAGIAVFVLFARINGLPGNNVWKSEKPLSLTRRVTRMKRKLTMTMFWEMTRESNLYSTNFNDLGIILFRRQCFIWCYIFEYQRNQNRAFPFWGTPSIITRANYMGNSFCVIAFCINVKGLSLKVNGKNVTIRNITFSINWIILPPASPLLLDKHKKHEEVACRPGMYIGNSGSKKI